VRLILAGALDGQNEQELGQRLGVSGRHLRRLFVERLGCTPSQLARSARAHFARRLLDDTDLSVIDLAFACGYGSVRQLSRDCLAIFRATPTELRARRRLSDRLVADGGLLLRMPYQPPLAWSAMLDYLRRYAISGVECVTAGTYRRTVVIDGDPGVLELSPGGPDYLLLRAHLPHWAGLTHISARARGVFGLDADYQAAERHLCGDLVIGPLMRRHPGLRPPGTWEPFEPALQAILTSNTGEAHGRHLTGELVRRYGKAVPGLAQLGLTHLFPSPAALADADLREIGCTPEQAVTVATFARAVVRHTLQLDNASTLNELITSLLAIPALTPPMAQYIALRLGQEDAYSGPSPTSAEQRWRPFRACAATYLAFSATGQITLGSGAHRLAGTNRSRRE
jgi:AraC family transcriptional regulator of adaptative response / DNA-3-methyladenine glycosylase II